MAFVVLCTTMSFTVNMHYCGDTLVDYALVQKAKSCGMELSTPSKNAGCDLQIVKKSCCQDKSVTAKGHDDLKPSFTSIDLGQQVFIASFFYSYAALFTPQTVTPKTYTNYLENGFRFLERPAPNRQQHQNPGFLCCCHPKIRGSQNGQNNIQKGCGTISGAFRTILKKI